MSISAKGEYAVMALLELALSYPDGGPVKASDIAVRQGISKKYLEQILLTYKGKGYIGSKSGQNGGYFLVKDPRDITIADALRVVEGPLAPVRCVSVTAYSKCARKIEATCALRTVWKEARDAMVGILEKTTLDDLAYRARNMAGDAAPMYYI
jgi:Rrf2 family protein